MRHPDFPSGKALCLGCEGSSSTCSTFGTCSVFEPGNGHTRWRVGPGQCCPHGMPLMCRPGLVTPQGVRGVGWGLNVMSVSLRPFLSYTGPPFIFSSAPSSHPPAFLTSSVCVLGDLSAHMPLCPCSLDPSCLRGCHDLSHHQHEWDSLSFRGFAS